MEKMNDLRALLGHEVEDLISAEDQIIAAMPMMIERAQNQSLKKALQEHLGITEKQRARLDQVQQLLNEGGEQSKGEEGGEEKKGFLSGLFGSLGKHTCKGMEGIITEGQKIMKEDMSPEVLDAAIIASAQKVEHYEICGYGTARAYARELGLGQVAELLEETLDEEYEADDRLTDLAVGEVNERAERAGKRGSKAAAGRGTNGQPAKKGVAAKKGAPQKAAAKGSAAKKGIKVTAAKKGAVAKKSSPKKAVKASAAKKGGRR